MENNQENTNVACKHRCKIISIVAIVLSVISILLSGFALMKCNRPGHDFRMGNMGYMGNMCDMPCKDFGNWPSFGQRPNMPQGNFGNDFNRGSENFGNRSNNNFNGNGNFNRPHNNQDRNFNGNNNGNFWKGFDFNRPNNNNSSQDNGPTTAPEITPNGQ